MPDKYKNFSELSNYEEHDVDFRVTIRSGRENILIIAPHGGKIEPGTSEIANLIASEEYSLYMFEGIKEANNRHLHITSSNFDEPRCIELASRAKYIVTVHGCIGEEEAVFIGGLDNVTGNAIKAKLIHSGFAAREHPDPNLQGRNRNNICNRNIRGQGVQLEISRALRDALCRDMTRARTFAGAVKVGLQEIV